MKKVMLIWPVLILGLSFKAFAKAGIADGGFEFIMVIVGFLLLVAGFLEGIDYLKKNGKGLFKRFRTFLSKKILTHRNSYWPATTRNKSYYRTRINAPARTCRPVRAGIMRMNADFTIHFIRLSTSIRLRSEAENQLKSS